MIASAMSDDLVVFGTMFCNTVRTSGTKLKIDFGGWARFQDWILGKKHYIVCGLGDPGPIKVVLASARD